MTLRTPHEHQASALELLRSSIKEGARRPLIQLPTGGGKTLLAAWIAQGALNKGKTLAFTVPALSLIDQTVREFSQEGMGAEIGVIQADHPLTNPSRPIQVCSIDTLNRRTLPDVPTVLVDEAHRRSKMMSKWMRDRPNTLFIGLSATPWSRGLGQDYDRLIVAATIGDLIDKKFLAPFRAFAPSHPDLTGVSTLAGDYHEGQLSAAMQRGALVGDLVENWIEKAEQRPTFVFCVDCAHARIVQREFTHAGISAAYLDAQSSRIERERVRKAFHAGEIKVVVNVGVLTLGIDWDVRCIVLARPTKSEILFVQMVGRGLRKADGKDHLLILDHSSTTRKLGFVTDIFHAQLDTTLPGEKRKVERAKPEPRECPKCQALAKKNIDVCWECGYAWPVITRAHTTSGEIVEIATRLADKRNKEASWTEKVWWMGGFKKYQLMTGKKDGWVAHKYRERFGVWPNDPRLRYARPLHEMPPVIRSWIQAGNIRYAKGMEKAATG